MAKVSFGKLLVLFCFLSLPVLSVKEEDTTRLVSDTWIKIMDRTKMLAYNYNGICDKDSIESFPEVNFIKNFMAVEFNTDVHPDNQVKLLATDLYNLLQQLNNFKKSIHSQLKAYKEYPRSFMQTKFLTLINITRSRLGLAEHVKTKEILEDSTKDKDPELSQRMTRGRKDIMFELKGKNFDFDYLSAAKGQLLLASRPADGHRHSPGYAEELSFFVDDLPKVLYQILLELDLEDPEKMVYRQYFIDFFVVFGDLIPRPAYAALILEFTAANGKEVIDNGLVYQDPNAPSLFKNKNVFGIDRELGGYTPFIKLDMIPFQLDKSHSDPLELVEIRKKNNSYYPKWMNFFDFPNNLPEQINTPENQEPNSPFKRATELIYNFYIHERSKDALKPINPENPAVEIADKLYNSLLNFKCFEEKEQCSFNKFTDPIEFSEHFLPMLTLLKPFTSNQEPFAKPELDAIEKEISKNGEDVVLKHLEPVAKVHKDIKEEIDKKGADTVSNKLGNILNTFRNQFDDLTEEDLGEEPVDEDDLEVIEVPVKDESVDSDEEIPEDISDDPEDPKAKTSPKKIEKSHDPKDKTSPRKVPKDKKEIKRTKNHKRRQVNAGKFKDLGRESKIYDIIDSQDAPIKEAIEGTFPVLTKDTTPENIDDKISKIEALINGNKNNLPVQKHVMNKYIKSKIEEIKESKPAEQGPIKAKVNDLLKTTINTTVDDVLSRTSDLKIEGFREYLIATLMNSFFKQNLETGKNQYYKDKRYETIRHFDIYAFVYYAKLKENKADALETERWIQQYDPLFNVKSLEETHNIHDHYHSLLFIGHFSKLFRLFKTRSDLSRETNNSIEHIEIFHKAYQFLCDLRIAYGLKITLQKSFKDHRAMVATHLMNCFRYTHASTVTVAGNFYKNNFTPEQFCKVHRFSNDGVNGAKNQNNFEHFDATFKGVAIENLEAKKAKWTSVTSICKYNFAFYSEILPLMVTFLSFNNDKTIVDIFYDIVYDSGIPIINIANFNFLLESSGAHREGHITSELSNMYYTFCKESVSMDKYKELSVDPEDEDEVTEDELPLMSSHEICSSYINFLKMRTFFHGADSTIETYKNGAANIMNALDFENVRTVQQAQNIIYQIWETVTMFAQHKNGLGVANYEKLTALFAISLNDQLKSENLASIRKIIKDNMEDTLASYFGLKFGNILANRHTPTTVKFFKGISGIFANEESLSSVLIAEDIFSNENAALLVSTANCPENFRAIAKILIKENQDKLLYTFTEAKSSFQNKLEGEIEVIVNPEDVTNTLINSIYARLAEKLPRTKKVIKNEFTNAVNINTNLDDDFSTVTRRKNRGGKKAADKISKETYVLSISEDMEMTQKAVDIYNEQTADKLKKIGGVGVVLVDSQNSHEFSDIATNYIKTKIEEIERRRRIRVLV